ncbi:glycosyltransferase family 9 protein [Rhodopila sp.]|uniref:glycosyltransferase family 9 protein n=1 Tax=Rhodopila sp. TaxID=2480087 RepID=UPI003D0D4758
MTEAAWPPYRHPVAVVQPLPGIGDMVWHVAHIRAIAAQACTSVTLLAKPRSLADQLLAGDPAIADVMAVDLNPGDRRRGAHDGISGFRRLVHGLRERGFGSIVLLHHSDRLAASAWMAGIPDRRGYGWGRQLWFLNTGPFLPPDVKALHQHTRATRYLRAAGIMPPSVEPRLKVSQAALRAALPRLGATPGGFVAIGIGSSERLRQWGTDRFASLAATLLDAGWPMLALVGGTEDQTSATTIVRLLGERGARARPMLGWDLPEVIAVLSAAAFYVGNNTGAMNIAAATGTRTYALFGTTRAFDHANQIVPVTASDIGVHDGMARVTLASVLHAIRIDRGRIAPG